MQEAKTLVKAEPGKRSLRDTSNIIWALAAISALTAIGVISGLSSNYVFAVIIPYAALAILFIGIIYRVLRWAAVPVPFHIPTTAGQEKSLPWIKNNELESPSSTWGVIGRMALEILLFRSLFRNDKAQLKEKNRIVFGGNRWLWLGGLVFHYSLATILFRHLRFFTEPVPWIVNAVGYLDGIMTFSVPTLFLTDIAILLALGYLFTRRAFFGNLRYLSLFSDYFALFLILGVAISGVLMRLWFKTDLIAVKELALGVVTFHPTLPAGLSMSFYVHLFFVCTLVAYFPFSKMMHAGGVFLSPTRNLANNSRMKRHANPWSYPVRVHTYDEWENEYREAMKKVGIPVEKE